MIDMDKMVEVVGNAIEKANPFDPYETNQYDLARAAIKAFCGNLPKPPMCVALIDTHPRDIALEAYYQLLEYGKDA